MDGIIAEVAKRIPELAALCFIVWTFLKSNAQQQSIFKEMHQEHLYARELTRNTVKENTDAMIANTKTVAELCSIIEKHFRRS